MSQPVTALERPRRLLRRIAPPVNDPAEYRTPAQIQEDIDDETIKRNGEKEKFRAKAEKKRHEGKLRRGIMLGANAVSPLSRIVTSV